VLLGVSGWWSCGGFVRAFGSVSVWYGVCAMRCLGVSGGGWLEAVFAAVFVPERSGVLHGGAPDFFMHIW
jgi:hypothetical protein